MATILRPSGSNLGFEGVPRLVYMRTAQFNLGTFAGMNKGLPLLGVAAILLLAGCSSTRVAVSNVGQAEQLAGQASTAAREQAQGAEELAAAVEEIAALADELQNAA